VFVLEQHLVGNIWLVFDASGGGHATQLHARFDHGFVIVDPHQISAGADHRLSSFDTQRDDVLWER
jgi:hypothetical protein